MFVERRKRRSFNAEFKPEAARAGARGRQERLPSRQGPGLDGLGSVQLGGARRVGNDTVNVLATVVGAALAFWL